MFLIHVHYKKSLDEVDKHIADHSDFLDRQYANKKFILSGRRNPRTGGIIMAYNCDRNELEKIVAQDPFYVHQIAEYEIIEFTPTKYDEALKAFIKQ